MIWWNVAPSISYCNSSSNSKVLSTSVSIIGDCYQNARCTSVQRLQSLVMLFSDHLSALLRGCVHCYFQFLSSATECFFSMLLLMPQKDFHLSFYSRQSPYLPESYFFYVVFLRYVPMSYILPLNFGINW